MADQNGANTSGVRRQLAVAVSVFGALALLGTLLGLLWWGIAPRPEGTALGGGQVFTGTTEDVFAGEGYFVIMTALAGLVTGYAAYMLQFPLERHRSQDLRMAFLLAGFLGSAAGTVLAWRIGVALDGPLHDALGAAEPGEVLTVGLQLDATAFLVVWPLVFVLQYGLLDAISFVRRDQPGIVLPEADAEVDGSADAHADAEVDTHAEVDGSADAAEPGTDAEADRAGAGPTKPPVHGATVAAERKPTGPEEPTR